ncbi:MAG: trypsin-like peptidase domain-containing protein [Clostridia bacterium]|nr:trypsin-like peptidase domain-containing protein [Clostridia bacterium]
MDEQLNNGMQNTTENNAPSAPIEGAGFVMSDTEKTETTAMEEQPPMAQPEAEQPAAGQSQVQQPAPEQTYFGQNNTNTTSQWQGGYSYQNPNPYQDYHTSYAVVPQKKNNTGLIVAVAVSVGIMALCCVAVVIAQLLNLSGVDLPENENDFVQNDPVINDTEETENKNSADRDEEAIYNMPDITTEEKSGETLSIVEINKKIKNSVVAILIAMDNGAETDFSGSGFIISEDGYIITNAHVVEGAAKVEVVLIDGITSYNATIVGQDTRSDLAILKIDAKGLSPCELGDSDQLEEGEEVVCIGNPYGMELTGSITNGIVSALNRKIEMNGGFMTLIQTNAQINPGNSGGPLINAYGQVVGITSSKLVATGYEGIGFAIPINEAIAISEELINYGYVKSRAYIGFSGEDLTAAYASYRNLPQGVYVVYVNPESNAAKKGLQEEDIVVGFNGQDILSMAELNDLKDSFHPGDQVTITVWRNGETFDLFITLTEASQ